MWRKMTKRKLYNNSQQKGKERKKPEAQTLSYQKVLEVYFNTSDFFFSLVVYFCKTEVAQICKFWSTGGGSSVNDE